MRLTVWSGLDKRMKSVTRPLLQLRCWLIHTYRRSVFSCNNGFTFSPHLQHKHIFCHVILQNTHPSSRLLYARDGGARRQLRPLCSRWCREAAADSSLNKRTGGRKPPVTCLVGRLFECGRLFLHSCVMCSEIVTAVKRLCNLLTARVHAAGWIQVQRRCFRVEGLWFSSIISAATF